LGLADLLRHDDRLAQGRPAGRRHDQPRDRPPTSAKVVARQDTDLGTPPTTSIEQRQNSPCHCLLNTLPLSRSFLHAKIFGSKAQSISLWLTMIVNLNKFV